MCCGNHILQLALSVGQTAYMLLMNAKRGFLLDRDINFAWACGIVADDKPSAVGSVVDKIDF